MGTVTDDFKEVSGSVKRVGENIEYVSKRMGESIEQVSNAVRHAADSSIGETRGITAGIKAGVGYFVKNAWPKRGMQR